MPNPSAFSRGNQTLGIASWDQGMARRCYLRSSPQSSTLLGRRSLSQASGNTASELRRFVLLGHCPIHLLIPIQPRVKLMVVIFRRGVFVLLGVLVATLAVPGSSAAETPLRPAGLRCEYRAEPIGMDVLQPRMSWVLESTDSAVRGLRQSAYQVLVASSGERLGSGQGDLWDSGRVSSDQTAHVAYAGRPLQSGQECFWKVRAWDAEGRASPWSRPARWTMGLLQAGRLEGQVDRRLRLAVSVASQSRLASGPAEKGHGLRGRHGLLRAVRQRPEGRRRRPRSGRERLRQAGPVPDLRRDGVPRAGQRTAWRSGWVRDGTSPASPA